MKGKLNMVSAALGFAAGGYVIGNTPEWLWAWLCCFGVALVNSYAVYVLTSSSGDGKSRRMGR